MNLVPGSVQPAPDLTQRLLRDVMVSCDTCNMDVRAGDYDSHECHRLGVIEEQCASKVILSESTKDNVIKIKTRGTVIFWLFGHHVSRNKEDYENAHLRNAHQ